jgi:hypothetical protein
MRKITSLALSCVALGAAALATPASATNYVFSETGFSDNATLTGTFSGSDVNSDGTIDGTELTAFTAIFSGNSVTNAFTVGLGDLYSFGYTLNGLLGGPNSGFLAIGADAFAEVGPPNSCSGGSALCGVVISPLKPIGQHTDTSTQQAIVNVLGGGTGTPEPGAWGMMMLGFGSIGAFLRGRRKPQDSAARTFALTPAL